MITLSLSLARPWAKASYKAIACDQLKLIRLARRKCDACRGPKVDLLTRKTGIGFGQHWFCPSTSLPQAFSKYHVTTSTTNGVAERLFIGSAEPTRIRLQLALRVGHSMGCCSKSIQALLWPILQCAHNILCRYPCIRINSDWLFHGTSQHWRYCWGPHLSQCQDLRSNVLVCASHNVSLRWLFAAGQSKVPKTFKRSLLGIA